MIIYAVAILATLFTFLIVVAPFLVIGIVIPLLPFTPLTLLYLKKFKGFSDHHGLPA